jgi:predicted deacetylase
MGKYIVRLDDACPTMDISKWSHIETILDKYDINPIVAVVPNNKDENLEVDKHDELFWEKVKRWQDKGWHIALHGYDHVYITDDAGLVPFNNRSEFAGLKYEEQADKIKKGIAIFKAHSIDVNIWVAPSHSFDKNTLLAIGNETDINIISDGISLSEYSDTQFMWIPQQVWYFREMKFGTWTGCFHPNEMEESEFDRLEKFVKNNKNDFVEINKLNNKRKKSIVDYIFNKLYWFARRFK